MSMYYNFSLFLVFNMIRKLKLELQLMKSTHL